MEYLYHILPQDMVGNHLVPLNHIKEIHPQIYEKELAKYDDHPGRQKLPKTNIPKLNCLWNDVVQFCPIHPNKLYKGWLHIGKTPEKSISFF